MSPERTWPVRPRGGRRPLRGAVDGTAEPRSASAAAHGLRPPVSGGPATVDAGWAIVLACCLAGWVALGLYVFLTPSPGRLTSAVDPLLGHLTIFGAIGTTSAGLFGNGTMRRLAGLFFAAVAGGAAIEVAQEVLGDTRGFDPLDIAADAVGVALGLGLVLPLHRSFGRSRLTAALVGSASLTSLVVVALGVYGAGA